MRNSTRFGKIRTRLGLVIAGSAVLALAVACGSSGSPHSVSSEEGKAKVVATAADKQLKTDGYNAVHLPAFGKLDGGTNFGTHFRYEVVYTAPGKDQQVVDDIVQAAQKKVAGNNGIHIRAAGSLVIMQAHSLRDVKDAIKAVLKSVK